MSESTTCPACGAVVGDQEAHNRWHGDLKASIAQAGQTPNLRDIDRQLGQGL